MAKSKLGTNLADIIESLRVERESHLSAINAIDDVFSAYGIAVVGPRRRRRPGRPAKKVAKRKVAKKKVAKKGRRSKRRKFKTSGDQSVLNFVAKAKNPTTAEVNKHWTAEGRGDVEQALLRQADTYEQRMTRRDKVVVSLAAPLTIMTVGFMVAFMVIALYLPIFTLGDAISGG